MKKKQKQKRQQKQKKKKQKRRQKKQQKKIKEQRYGTPEFLNENCEFVPVHTFEPQYIKFDNYDSPFFFAGRSCANGKCPDRKIALDFIEVDESHNFKKGGLHFDLHLDLNTWQEEMKPSRTPVADQLVEAIINNPDPDFKKQLADDLKYHKKSMRKALRFKLPHSRAREGSLVASSEVFALKKPRYRSVFGWESEGSFLLADDSYCINPRCKCNAAHLTICKIEISQKKQPSLDHLFSVSMSFKNGFNFIELKKWNKKDAASLIQSWTGRNPSVIEVMKFRYKLIRSICRRFIA